MSWLPVATIHGIWAAGGEYRPPDSNGGHHSPELGASANAGAGSAMLNGDRAGFSLTPQTLSTISVTGPMSAGCQPSCETVSAGCPPSEWDDQPF